MSSPPPPAADRAERCLGHLGDFPLRPRPARLHGVGRRQVSDSRAPREELKGGCEYVTFALHKRARATRGALYPSGFSGRETHRVYITSYYVVYSCPLDASNDRHLRLAPTPRLRGWHRRTVAGSAAYD
eukprot:817763-Prorocentrum_minimum.AAC.1